MTEQEKGIDSYFKEHFKEHFEANPNMTSDDYNKVLNMIPEDDSTKEFLRDKFYEIDQDGDELINASDVKSYFDREMNSVDNEGYSNNAFEDIKTVFDKIYENYDDTYQENQGDELNQINQVYAAFKQSCDGNPEDEIREEVCNLLKHVKQLAQIT